MYDPFNSKVSVQYCHLRHIHQWVFKAIQDAEDFINFHFSGYDFNSVLQVKQTHFKYIMILHTYLPTVENCI